MKFIASALVALSSVSLASAECCVPEVYLTKLDFHNSTLAHNDLHVGGNTTYAGVGTFENKRLDLVVTADDDYRNIEGVWQSRGKLKNGDKTLNGLKGSFGKINLQTVKREPDSGKGTFKFCLYDENEELAKLPAHTFSIYDADIRGEGKAIEEKLVVDFDDTENAGIKSFQLGNSANTSITVTCEGAGEIDDELGICKGGATVFNSGEAGVGADNPSDPNNLTDKQKRRSILFTMENTSCWTFTYNHYCPYEQVGYEPQEFCKGYTGGYFLFAGHADQIMREEECNPTHPTEPPTVAPSEAPTDPGNPAPPLSTPSPTVSTPSPTASTPSPTVSTPSPTASTPSPTASTPSPTVSTPSPTVSTPSPTVSTPSPTVSTPSPTVSTPSPTVSTPSPTVSTPSPTVSTPSPTVSTPSPTVSPTDPPVDPPTPECPADIELVKQIGVTDIDMGGSIEIVSRVEDKVTVKLTNTWADALDIYYQYKPDVFNEKCFKKEDVAITTEYADITLQCYHTKPFTELEICVTAENTTYLKVEDNAEVPKCCDTGEDDFAVCYHLIVWCEDQCPTTGRKRALRALRGHA